MSFINLESTTLADGAQKDAFGRLRVSNNVTIFDVQFEYTNRPLLWEFVSSGGGAQAYSTTVRHITLSTAGSVNGRAMRRTKVYHRYQPGKSQLVKMTGVPHASGTHSATSETRMGYYDDSNGIFFGTDSSGSFWTRRTNTSGSVVDNKVASASWNIDPFDGTGPSGIVLDASKTQIIVIDLQWLGVGRVRCGFQIDGILYYAHEFLNANVITVPYMRTANLPLSYEIANGASGATLSMTQVCSAIESEGGVPTETGLIIRAGTAGNTVSCANTPTLTPIFSIRLVDTYGGIPYRGHVHPEDLEFLNTSANPAYYEIIWNAATLTGATFAQSADATYSGVQYDLAATAYTGGFVIGSGYISAEGVGSKPDTATSKGLDQKLILARTYGNVRDTITIAARGVGGAATLAATMNCLEQY